MLEATRPDNTAITAGPNSASVPGSGLWVLLAITLCFALSGFAALLYQTAWMRQFSLVFGTSELAVATVLPAVIVRVPDGRSRAIVEAPLEIDRGRDREEALAANVRRYVAILERYVAGNPEQWYCFYPFWEDPSRRPA